MTTKETAIMLIALMGVVLVGAQLAHATNKGSYKFGFKNGFISPNIIRSKCIY